MNDPAPHNDGRKPTDDALRGYEQTLRQQEAELLQEEQMLLQQARSAEAFLDSPAPPNRWVTPAFFSVWRIAFILLIVPAGVFAWRLIKLASGD